MLGLLPFENRFIIVMYLEWVLSFFYYSNESHDLEYRRPSTARFPQSSIRLISTNSSGLKLVLRKSSCRERTSKGHYTPGSKGTGILANQTPILIKGSRDQSASSVRG